MFAGKLDRVLTIQKRSATIGEAGNAVETWNSVGTLRARRISNEDVLKVGEAGGLDVDHEAFEARYIDGLTINDRILFEGAPYQILAISEVGRRRGLALKLRRIAG